MKKIILLLLIPAFAIAQKPKLLFWVQTRDMNVNHSMSEFRVAPDSLLPHDTLYIHDTLWRSPPAPSSYSADTALMRHTAVITQFSGMSIRMVGGTTYRSSRVKKKPQKRRVVKRNRILMGEGACPLDTIVGILTYNNGDDYPECDARDSGYYVGCGFNSLHFSFDDEWIIPAVYLKTESYYDNGKRRSYVGTTNVRQGRFYLLDGRNIPIWRVYFLTFYLQTQNFFLQ